MAAAGALDVVSRLTTCAASTLHDFVSTTFPDRLRRASAETNRLYAMSESWDSGARRSVLQQKLDEHNRQAEAARSELQYKIEQEEIVRVATMCADVVKEVTAELDEAHQAALQTKLDDATQSEAALQTKLDDATQSEAALQTKLDDATQSEAALQTKLAAATQSEAALRAQLDDTAQSEAALRAQLAAATAPQPPKCWPIEDFFWEGAINRAW
jgi:predicted ribosome quality control (RQC) complex YloA/Tae2 family protein